jgi:CheY-like chemotaxis protein
MESILDGKRILAVDDESDILALLEEEILEACPNCQFDKATSYETAIDKLQSNAYDMVILDIMGVRGFDLLDMGVKRNLKVVILTAHALIPEALKQSFERKARAYLPKEKLGEIVPFLEDIFLETDGLSGWARLMRKLEGFLNSCWGENWQKKDEKFWKEFEEKTAHIKW